MRQLFSVFLLLILSACGGGSGDGSSTPAAGVSLTPARVEISSRSALLSAPGQTQLLTARVYNAEGQEISAAVAWESSRPSEVSVSTAGLLTATGAGGSSQIVARAGEVRSVPLLAVHTTLPADALLVADANIVGDPVETSPGAPGSMDNTYQVALTGVAAPQPGRLLINTGDKVVAGRVVAVRSDAGVHTVTLALVPARTLFPRLQIDETLDLSQAEVAVPEDIQAMYEVQRNGGQFTFTPKPGAISLSATTRARRLSADGRATAQAFGDPFKLGPFKCKPVGDGAAGAGSTALSLTLPPVFTVAINPRLELRSSPSGKWDRFVVHAEPTAAIEVGLKTLIAAEIKITCEAELFEIKVPVGGPLALLIGGVLPVGVGVELGGKLTLLNMGISGKGTVKTSGALGLSCPATGSCGLVHDFGPVDASLAPVIDVPSLTDGRLEPSLSLYATVKAAIGHPFFTSLRFDAFKAKAGLALKGNFAPAVVQMFDSGYQSDYKLVAEVKAGADTGFTGLAGFLGLNAFAETLLEVSADLITTPVGTVKADKARAENFETIKFTVQLDPTKVNALQLYNVEQVLMLNSFGIEVGRINAAPGQTEFNFDVVVGSSLVRSNGFYAFVVTKMLPTDKLPLEIGQAQGPAQTGQRLAVGGSHTCAITSGGAVKCWGGSTLLGGGGSTSVAVPIPAPQQVVGLTSGVQSIAAGTGHTCALDEAGALLCWGANQAGQLGNGQTLPNDLRAFVLQPVRARVSEPATWVRGNGSRTCAVTRSGAVHCWGCRWNNANCEVIPTPRKVTELAEPVVAVSVGAYHTCALTSVGGVVCWGGPRNGRLGNGSDSGPNVLVAVPVPGLASGVVAIESGNEHTCALTQAGAVQCWGRNYEGQLGDGGSTFSTRPVTPIGLTSGVQRIDMRHHQSCAVMTDGSARCWGTNFMGRGSSTPAAVQGLLGPVQAMVPGLTHQCAMLIDERLQCKGANFSGELGNGRTSDSDADEPPVLVVGWP